MIFILACFISKGNSAGSDAQRPCMASHI